MKKAKIIILSFILGLFLSGGLLEQAAEAQPSKVPPGGPFSPVQPKGACRLDPSITFNEEQAKKLELLQRAFMEEAKPLLSELRDLRLELRLAVSDPKAQSKILLEKQRGMLSIQAKLEDLRFSYLIRARAIFSKEQLERMPRDCPLKMGTGYGMGRSLERRPRRGIR